MKIKIDDSDWGDTLRCEVSVTRECDIKEEHLSEALEKFKLAEVAFDKVFIEVERVYACRYDCTSGLREAA